MIVILSDDESLTLHNIAHNNVRTFLKPVEISIDDNLLVKAVIKAKNDDFLLLLLLKACS